MPYSDFTLNSAIDRLGVRPEWGPLFPGAPECAPPAWLVAWLGRLAPEAYMTEKSRSEAIVYPVLLGAGECAGGRFRVFSGLRLDADRERGLNGECDFILGGGPPLPALRTPLLTVVEAKQADIELGWGQCIAQMVGAREFNAAAGGPPRPIYGGITTGEVWQFLKLDAAGPGVTMGTRRLFLDNQLPAVLGALVAAADDALAAGGGA